MAGMSAGEVYLELRADASGLVAQTAAASRAAGAAGDRGLRGGLAGAFTGVKGLALAGIGGGVAAGVAMASKASLGLAADFGATMAQLKVAASVPADEMASLEKTAKEFGASTVFSAGEAADAMLNLAKAGLTPAEIQAGALKGTMDLAAIEGMELADAADVAANTMAQFGLNAKDLPRVIDAMAGASNASTASVGSLSMGLQQVGPAAKTAGLSVNDTLATLALFDKNALKGADAGTSLKTMLTRLVPSTKAAKDEMSRLGIDFTNADGSMKSMVDVAGILQKEMGGLSAEERTLAVNRIFGSDAARAANILIDEGAAGMTKMTEATQKVGGASEMANARMSGLGGATEKMKGAIEGAGLALGQVMEPAAIAVADGIGSVADKAAQAIPKLGSLFKSASGGGSAFAGLGGKMRELGSGIAETGRSIGKFLSGLMPTIRNFAQSFMNVLGPGLKSIVDVINGQFLPAIRAILPVILPVAKFLLNVFGTAVVGALKGALQFIKGAIQMISGIINVFAGILTGDWSRAWNGLKGIVQGAWNVIIGFIRVALNVGILGIFRKGFAGLKALVTGGWAALRGLFTGGMSGIGNIVGRISGVMMRPFTAAWNAVRGLVTRGWQAVRNLFSGGQGIGGIRSILARLLNIMTTPHRLAWNAVRRLVTAGWNVVRGLFTRGNAALISALRALPGRILGIFRNVHNFMRQQATNAWNTVRRLFSSGASAVVSFIRSLPSRIASIFRSAGQQMRTLMQTAWRNVKNAATTGANNVVSYVRGVPGRFVGAMGNVKDLLLQVGRDIMEGLLRGITAGAEAVFRKAGEIAGGVKDKIAGALRIGSPSRVMMEIGGWTTEGLAIGMDQERAQVDAAAERLARAAVPAIPTVTPGGVRTSASVAPVASGGPLIGALTLQADGQSVHRQMEEVTFALRRIQRGGVYA